MHGPKVGWNGYGVIAIDRQEMVIAIALKTVRIVQLTVAEEGYRRVPRRKSHKTFCLGARARWG